MTEIYDWEERLDFVEFGEASRRPKIDENGDEIPDDRPSLFAFGAALIFCGMFLLYLAWQLGRVA